MLWRYLLVLLKSVGVFLALLYAIGVLGAYRSGRLHGVSDLTLSVDAWRVILVGTLAFALFGALMALLTSVVFGKSAPNSEDNS